MDLILSEAGPNLDVGKLLDLLVPDASKLKHPDFDALLDEINKEVEVRNHELQRLIRELVAENGSATWPDQSMRELQTIIAQERDIATTEVENVKNLLSSLDEIEEEKAGLEESISLLEKLEIYRTNLQQLRSCVSHKDYSQIAGHLRLLLSIDQKLSEQKISKFAQLKNIGISETALADLRESFRSTCLELRHRAQEDFTALDDRDSSSAEFSRKLCEIIGLVCTPGGYGPLMQEFFGSRLNQYNLQFQVRCASSLKVDRKAAASQQMRTFSKRKAWLKPDEIASDRFPPDWLAGDFFLQHIASLTRNHLSELLDIVHDDLSYDELCSLMRDVKMLEQSMTQTSRLLRERNGCSSSQEDSASFGGSLTKLFDGFTQPWYTHMKGLLQDIMSMSLTTKDSIVEAPNIPEVQYAVMLPRLIHLSAQKLIDQISYMTEECRAYAVSKINQDSAILVEKFVVSYLGLIRTEINKWNFSKKDRQELAQCTRVLSSEIKLAQGSGGDDFGSQTSLESAGNKKASSSPPPDFSQLVCMNSSLEWIWLWINRQWQPSSSDELELKGVLATEIWKVRNLAYESMLCHFLVTTIRRHLSSQEIQVADLSDQWRQWLSEIDSFCSISLSGVFKDASAILFAEALKTHFNEQTTHHSCSKSDLTSRMIEWFTEELSVVGADELRAVSSANRSTNILY